MNKDENVSAFVFKVGVTLEELIAEHTKDLQERNNMLEAKVMQWYLNTKDKDFAEYFGIVTSHYGTIY